MRHTSLVGIIPAREVLLSNAIDCFDAELIDEWLGSFFNIEKRTDKAAHVGCNPDNTLHRLNSPKSFNGSFCFGAMRFSHFNCPFVTRIVLCSTGSKKFSRVILTDKGKDCDGVGLKK